MRIRLDGFSTAALNLLDHLVHSNEGRVHIEALARARVAATARHERAGTIRAELVL